MSVGATGHPRQAFARGVAVLTGVAAAFLSLAAASCGYAAEKPAAGPLIFTCPLTAKLRISQQFEFIDVPDGWRAFGTASSDIETVWQFDHISSAGRIFCVYRRDAAGGTETRHVYERDWPEGYACRTNETRNDMAVCHPVRPGREEP